MSTATTNYCNSSVEPFLNKLAKQLLLITHENFEGPRVKISLEDKLKCKGYKAPNQGTTENVVVKQEIEKEDTAARDRKANFSWLANHQDVTDVSQTSTTTKMCALCLQTITEPAFCHQYDISLVCVVENYILRKVFRMQSSPETAKFAQNLVFCRRCFKCVEHLKLCYVQFRHAEKQYQETLMRLRCFKKQAQSAASNTTDNSRYTNDEYYENYFEESFQLEAEDESAELSQTSNVTLQITRKGRRRGRLTEEEYREHRRVQLAGYHLKKKRESGKFDAVPVRKPLKSGNLVKHVGKIIEINTEPEMQKTDSVRDEECLMNANDTNNSETSSDHTDSPVLTAPKTDFAKWNKKKDSNRKGRTTRRRGGLTEEQKAGYCIERRNSQKTRPSKNRKATEFCEKRTEKAVIIARTQNAVQKVFGDFDDKQRSGTDENPIIVKEETDNSNEIPGSQTSDKKKYDYKGKTVRRRGGMTEEEYQAHRRAQYAQYYFERKKRLGLLKYGPIQLSAVKKAKLKKDEKIALYSNNLPPNSSSGIHVPVISIEDGKRFSYRQVEITKGDDDKYSCCNCGHLTKSMKVMKQHIAKSHFDKDKGHKCSYCNKSFYYKSRLKCHEARHTENGAGIQCEECGQSFKFYSGYYHHRRSIHQGIKPHECSLCKKKFACKKDLRKHMASKKLHNLKSDSKKAATGEEG